MTKRIFGKPIQRIEDARLLTGRAQYIDDIQLAGMLHAAFLRSDYAHARVRKIDVSAALQRPGVVAVYTAGDFGEYWKPGPLQVPPPSAIPGAVFNARTLIPIAKDMVRYSGEPLALVIAESRYIAEDALADIVVDMEPLPVVVDLEKALEPGAPLVHDDLPSNLAANVKQEIGNYAEAAAKADLVIKRRLHIDRGAGAAIENRGFVVDWDEKAQSMTIWASTQAPIPLRNSISARLGLSDTQVRVITPFIGGAFGPKIMTSMPDDVLLPIVARWLKRPIKWIEDRRENFLATTSERDQLHYAELALTKEGKILGLKDVFYHNTGAYDPYGMTVPLNTQTHTMASYNVPNFYTEVRMVFTNKMVVTPVRGAGRTYGIFVMERMMDEAAKELGMDPVEIRLKNLIQPDQFPLATGITGQDFVENVLDSGNYPATLQKAREMIEYEKFKKEIQPKLRREGKHVGIGVVCFVEGTGVGPYEGARVAVDTGGKVSVATGISTQGQGHFTVFAQIAAEQLGVDIHNVRVVTGDTGVFHWGAGTFASRGAVVAGSAVNKAALLVRQKILKLASSLFQVSEDKLVLEDGLVKVSDDPGKSMPLGELSAKSAPTRGITPADFEPGLEATAYYGPPYGATGQGTEAMIVEVDPETLEVKIQRFVLVHDCGTVINPMILEGQVQGGVMMGIGNSYYEQMIYDDNGQLMNASFMDYLMPEFDRYANEDGIGSPIHPLAAQPPGHERGRRGRRHPDPLLFHAGGGRRPGGVQAAYLGCAA